MKPFPLRVLLLLLLAVSGSIQAAELPGVWSEFESGGWHTAAKDSAAASGGKRVSWFDQEGRAVYVTFALTEPMPKAVLFLRYSRALEGDGKVDTAFGPLAAGAKPQNVPPLGLLRLPRTGGWERYRWVATPVGDLPAGNQVLVVRATARNDAGDLDVAGLAPDDPASRWMPPNEVKDGRFVGPGALADARRADDRMDAKAQAEASKQARQQAEKRAQAGAAAAAVREALTGADKRLETRVTWFGNDIAEGDSIPRDTGYTPHNVADIHVTPEGDLFTNVPWEEHGGNVMQFREGQWIADARVGNHGGGRAVAANTRHVYLAGNKHRTGEQGLDRRDRADLANQELNVHVDCGTVHGLAVSEERVFASVPAEDAIKLFDADLKPLGSWPVASPGKLALDPQGRLWVALPSEQAVACFARDGTRLPQQSIALEKDAVPADLAADARGRLLIADGGPSEQVLIYEKLDGAPILSARFGQAGGLYSVPSGHFGPQRFVRIAGVGADAGGNLYVASRTSNNGSTLLQSYAPDGALLWQKQCSVWLDCPDVHPDDPALLFSSAARMRVNLDAPLADRWKAEALTVQHRLFPDDVRVRTGGSGGTFIKRLGNGQVYQYLVDMLGKQVSVYRFEAAKHGGIAIPAGFVAQNGIWTDLNGDGRRDAAGMADMTFDLSLRGTRVDNELKLELTSLDANGHRRSLSFTTGAAALAGRAGFGVYAGGARKFDVVQFGVTVTNHCDTVAFGQAAGRSAAGGFTLSPPERWALTDGALRGEGNRKGGDPNSCSASRDFAALANAREFELRLTVRTPRGNLYGDRFGLVLAGADPKGRTSLAAVVDNRGGYPELQFRKGLGGDTLASCSLSEEVRPHAAADTVGMGVDREGTIWNASHTKGIVRYPVTGFTAAGAPIYKDEAATRHAMPAPFTELRRVYHYPERGGLLLVNGFTDAHRNVRHHWKRAGKVLRCYEGWTPEQPPEAWKLRWELVPPYEDREGGNDGDGNIMSIDVAGDYVFIAREGQSPVLGVNRCHVEVYRLDDARYVGWMGPSPETGDVGILDITQAMKAFRRADGEYWVLLEEGAKARTLVYRWMP